MSTKSWDESYYVTSRFCMEYIIVSYWTKAVGNTFENTYWLNKINHVFMTSTKDQQQWRSRK